MNCIKKLLHIDMQLKVELGGNYNVDHFSLYRVRKEPSIRTLNWDVSDKNNNNDRKSDKGTGKRIFNQIGNCAGWTNWDLVCSGCILQFFRFLQQILLQIQLKYSLPYLAVDSTASFDRFYCKAVIDKQ